MSLECGYVDADNNVCVCVRSAARRAVTERNLPKCKGSRAVVDPRACARARPTTSTTIVKPRATFSAASRNMKNQEQTGHWGSAAPPPPRALQFPVPSWNLLLTSVCTAALERVVSQGTSRTHNGLSEGNTVAVPNHSKKVTRKIRQQYYSTLKCITFCALQF